MMDRGFQYKHVRKGPLITGVALFTLTYGWTAFAAYKLHESCGTANQFQGCRRKAKTLFIPVAGPWLNIKDADDRGEFTGMVASGIGQGLGAGLIVVGSVLVARDRRANRLLNEQGIRVGKHANLGTADIPGGTGLALRGRF